MADTILPNHKPTRQRKETVESRAYQSARTRCSNPNDRKYHRYGGRGIEFRFTSFEEFFNEVGTRPSQDYTLDRIDVNGHYEVGNVRWATQLEQNRNRGNTPYLTMDGITRPLSEWAEITGINQRALWRRKFRGWCDSCSLLIPLRHKREAYFVGCTHKRSTNDTTE